MSGQELVSLCRHIDAISAVVKGPIAAWNSPGVFNPWAMRDPMDIQTVIEEPLLVDPVRARQARLIRHFSCDAETILIGEAPGYQGCHFSGVPFTNEALIVNGEIPRMNPWHNLRFTSRKTPWSEPSATIVWSTLYKLGIAHRTVMWNAFAWHPHAAGASLTNRAPTKGELKQGGDVLRAVIDLFPRARVIAVGNIAAESLKKLGVNVEAKVRHPSMGGANKFRAGMEELFRKV